MKIFNHLITAAVFFICADTHAHAQTPPPPPRLINDDSSKPENIIITKKNPVKDKVTIILDGNNVTVNGKPIDDFVSKDIDIRKSDMPDLGDMNFDFSDAPHGFAYSGGDDVITNNNWKDFHSQMNTHINANKAFLGVMSENNDKGAKITDVTKASAADKAGLKKDDIITKINDTAVNGPDDLYKIIGNHKPSDKITVSYLRDGKSSGMQVVLGRQNQMRVYSWNAPNGDAFKDFGNNFNHNFSFSWDNDKPRLGITAQDTEDGNGVTVTGIDDEDAVAAKAGLKENDVITQINGKAVNSTDDLKQTMKDVKKGDILKIIYKRNNQTQTVDAKFPKELKTIDL